MMECLVLISTNMENIPLASSCRKISQKDLQMPRVLIRYGITLMGTDLCLPIPKTINTAVSVL